MDFNTIQDFAQKIPAVPIDILLVATIFFCAYGAFKRGFYRETLIAIGYVPYLASLFFLFNEFIQGKIGADSMFFKFSSLGGFYLAYLFIIWATSKAIYKKFEAADVTIKVTGKAIAAVIGTFRTLYFFILCIMFLNLHVSDLNMVDKSKVAKGLNPYALELQEFLLDEDYIDNEITIYEQAKEATFENGKYVHPLMRKLQESEKFKQIEATINKDKLKDDIGSHFDKYMN